MKLRNVNRVKEYSDLYIKINEMIVQMEQFSTEVNISVLGYPYRLSYNVHKDNILKLLYAEKKMIENTLVLDGVELDE